MTGFLTVLVSLLSLLISKVFSYPASDHFTISHLLIFNIPNPITLISQIRLIQADISDAFKRCQNPFHHMISHIDNAFDVISINTLKSYFDNSFTVTCLVAFLIRFVLLSHILLISTNIFVLHSSYPYWRYESSFAMNPRQ